MEATPENLKKYRLARWHFKFTAFILAMHEGRADKGSLAWLTENAEHVNRHSLAKEDLDAFPREWAELYP